MCIRDRCFDDTEEFVQFYFDKKYKDENALVYWDEQGAAIAALQTPLYPMTFGMTQIMTGYISGACTCLLYTSSALGG